MPDFQKESARVDQPTVLIISDDAEFARSIATRWQNNRQAPAFTLMSADLFQTDLFQPDLMQEDRGDLNPHHPVDAVSFELAILDSVPAAMLPRILKVLSPARKPILSLSESDVSPAPLHPQIMCLRKNAGWFDAVVLVAGEVLKCAGVAQHARDLEQSNATLAHQATLGRYMLESRHMLNNALTSVLGNSELLLLEPNAFADGPRLQIETLRNMAMRMHEVLQRFSSLDKEYSLLDLQTQQGTGRSSATAGSS